MFAAHGLVSQTDTRVWRSHEKPPPYHSNLVVLSPLTTQIAVEAYIAELESILRGRAWSIKDSYASLDLEALGFVELFAAHWIWRDPVKAVVPHGESRFAWTRVRTAQQLEEWERAWSNDVKNEAGILHQRQFPDRLLDSADHAFFTGHVYGKIVAGGVVNRSPEVVGISNVFSPRELVRESWSTLVNSLSAVFPNTPIVGYERGADLEVATEVGFVPIGPLRVWCRSA
jgi:hypothetical protein